MTASRWARARVRERELRWTRALCAPRPLSARDSSPRGRQTIGWLARAGSQANCERRCEQEGHRSPHQRHQHRGSFHGARASPAIVRPAGLCSVARVATGRGQSTALRSHLLPDGRHPGDAWRRPVIGTRCASREVNSAAEVQRRDVRAGTHALRQGHKRQSHRGAARHSDFDRRLRTIRVVVPLRGGRALSRHHSRHARPARAGARRPLPGPRQSTARASRQSALAR